MKEVRKDYYGAVGIQVDANPFLSKDTELIACQNMYSNRLYGKKVRFGYERLGTNNPDAQPIRNLIYYDFPNGSRGILRVSGSKIYNYNFSTGDWNGPVNSDLTADLKVGWTIMAGQVTYLHIVDGSGLYLIFDGVTFTQVVGGDTPKARYLGSYNSRVLADRNQLRFAQSAIDFNLNSGYTTDPFKLNSNDPAGGGAISIEPGTGGRIIAISKVKGTPYVYKENGVYRFTGSGEQPMDYFDQVVPDTVANHKKTGVDYFLSSNAIMKNDGSTIQEASFGVNTIISETVDKLGISAPFAGSWGNYTFFWIGSLYVSGEIVPNAMLVHDERWDEWYVWQTGHVMTCFGSYTDDTGAVRMLTGDAEGNVYVWGEEFSSDAGKSIPYRLRTRFYFGDYPESVKKARSLTTALAKATGATISIAKNGIISYTPISGNDGGISTGVVPKDDLGMFLSYSLEIAGQTQDTRPEYYGHTLKYVDVNDQGREE